MKNLHYWSPIRGFDDDPSTEPDCCYYGFTMTTQATDPKARVQDILAQLEAFNKPRLIDGVAHEPVTTRPVELFEAFDPDKLAVVAVVRVPYRPVAQ